MSDGFEILRGSEHLSRAQRRQMKKLGARVEKIVDADRRFFQRFPHRHYRVRLAGRAEIEHDALLAGNGRQLLPPDLQHYAIIKNVAPGARLRIIVIGDEGWDTDLPEQEARKLYEAACTSQRDPAKGRL
ncbi:MULTISPECIES: hypothetical protein [Bradyrhizobium]|uniref:hypothetical protein n=1 Tax=Bradyrhizobium elkanii TaxID=29448 RepID=UPI0003FB7613|nr:hypothetical protein [Bradyrhizobium elkanii]